MKNSLKNIYSYLYSNLQLNNYKLYLYMNCAHIQELNTECNLLTTLFRFRWVGGGASPYSTRE
jgi:hypothetical protein